jgi:hypothetical protein
MGPGISSRTYKLFPACEDQLCILYKSFLEFQNALQTLRRQDKVYHYEQKAGSGPRLLAKTRIKFLSYGLIELLSQRRDVELVS